MGWLYATQCVDFGLSHLFTDPKADHLNLTVVACLGLLQILLP
jgi:hypothetical protein